jgi:hypothetical protein
MRLLVPPAYEEGKLRRSGEPGFAPRHKAIRPSTVFPNYMDIDYVRVYR